MKALVTKKVEIEIATVDINVAVRYGDGDMPYDFPHRSGNIWSITVDIDTGKIHDWPNPWAYVLHMKVCDSGTYTLRDLTGKQVAKLSDYVPHGLIPGEYGDYIIMEIDPSGVIKNWGKMPSVEAFFPEE